MPKMPMDTFSGLAGFGTGLMNSLSQGISSRRALMEEMERERRKRMAEEQEAREKESYKELSPVSYSDLPITQRANMVGTLSQSPDVLATQMGEVEDVKRGVSPVRYSTTGMGPKADELSKILEPAGWNPVTQQDREKAMLDRGGDYGNIVKAEELRKQGKVGGGAWTRTPYQKIGDEAFKKMWKTDDPLGINAIIAKSSPEEHKRMVTQWVDRAEADTANANLPAKTRDEWMVMAKAYFGNPPAALPRKR